MFSAALLVLRAFRRRRQRHFGRACLVTWCCERQESGAFYTLSPGTGAEAAGWVSLASSTHRPLFRTHGGIMEHARTTTGFSAKVGSLALMTCLLAGLSACSSGPENVVEATVTQVIDAGTVEVSTEDGDKQTIVLTGLDLPRDEAGGAPDCLSAESKEFIRDKLPSGAAVQVRFGTAAAATEPTATGTLLLTGGADLGAALVREGLAIPATAGAQDVDAAELLAAQEAARSAEAGLYSEHAPCTVPGQVAALGAGVNCAAVQAQVALSTTGSTISPSSPATTTATSTSTTSTALTATVAASGSAEIAGQVKSAALLVERAAALQQSMLRDANSIVWRALNDAQRMSCSTFINDAVAFAIRDHNHLSAALLVAQQEEAEAARVAEEQRLAVEAEAARVAAEQQAVADAESARVAAAQEAEAQRRAAAAAAAQQSASNSSGGSGGSPSSGSPGSPSTYTGPRCYAPGGLTWKPC